MDGNPAPNPNPRITNDPQYVHRLTARVFIFSQE